MLKRMLANPATWIIVALLIFAALGARLIIPVPISGVFVLGLVLYVVYLYWTRFRVKGVQSRGPYCTFCSHDNHAATRCGRCSCESS